MRAATVCASSVSSRPPKTGGEIAMFRGKGYGGEQRGGVWGGAVSLPNGGLGAVPPEKFLKFGNKY